MSIYVELCRFMSSGVGGKCLDVESGIMMEQVNMSSHDMPASGCQIIFDNVCSNQFMCHSVTLTVGLIREVRNTRQLPHHVLNDS